MTNVGTFRSTGSRAELVRRHNLGLILRRVHLAPASRSALTRATGLNRSTVGALVGELVERELVVEAAPAATGALGRPSPVVRPADRRAAIAVHPELDAVTVGLVLLGGRVLARRRVPFGAPPTVAAAVAAAADAAHVLLAEAPDLRIVGAGAAVPGMVRRADGLVRLAPHLAWRDAPVAALLAEALGTPTAAANDGALGAQGEWIFGAGREIDDLVYLNGGASGIGGGIVSGGVLQGGATGHAGEFGHVAVRRGGSQDTVGARGTLESEVSRDRLLAAVGLRDTDPDALEAAVLSGDSPALRREVHRQIGHLAVALGTAVTVLNPSRIVLGGFLSALAAADPEGLARQVAARVLPDLGEPVDIRRAELGSDLLLIGAAELAFARLFDDPALEL